MKHLDKSICSFKQAIFFDKKTITTIIGLKDSLDRMQIFEENKYGRVSSAFRRRTLILNR